MTMLITPPFSNWNWLPVSMSFTDSSADTVSRTTYTLTTQAIGTAANDRYIAVLAGALCNISGLKTINSITVGGISGTESITASQATGVRSSIWLCGPVTTGTTASIVVTFSGSVAWCFIACWRFTSLLSTTPTNTWSQNGSDNDPSQTGVIPANGAGVSGVIVAIDGPYTSSTWTNLTENFDTAPIAGGGYTGASSSTAGSATRSTNITTGGPYSYAWVGAAYR